MQPGSPATGHRNRWMPPVCGHQGRARLTTRAAFTPPKPKAFDRTWFTEAARSVQRMPCPAPAPSCRISSFRYRSDQLSRSRFPRQQPFPARLHSQSEGGIARIRHDGSLHRQKGNLSHEKSHDTFANPSAAIPLWSALQPACPPVCSSGFSLRGLFCSATGKPGGLHICHGGGVGASGRCAAQRPFNPSQTHKRSDSHPVLRLRHRLRGINLQNRRAVRERLACREQSHPAGG